MIGDLFTGDKFRLFDGIKPYIFLGYKPPYAKVRNRFGHTAYLRVKASELIVRITS